MSSLLDAADSQRGLAPVTTPTLVESVAEAIRGSILAGRFAPGERFLYGPGEVLLEQPLQRHEQGRAGGRAGRQARGVLVGEEPWRFSEGTASSSMSHGAESSSRASLRG